MTNLGETGCFVCFNKKQHYLLLEYQEYEKLISECAGFLHAELASSCQWNCVNSSYDQLQFCSDCFHSAQELIQLTEMSSKLQKEISDKKIGLSMAVYYRRSLIEEGDKDSDGLFSSQKQEMQLKIEEMPTPPQFVSANRPFPAAEGELELPDESNNFEMGTPSVVKMEKDEHVEIAEKSTDDNYWSMYDDCEQMLPDVNMDDLEQENSRSVSNPAVAEMVSETLPGNASLEDMPAGISCIDQSTSFKKLAAEQENFITMSKAAVAESVSESLPGNASLEDIPVGISSRDQSTSVEKLAATNNGEILKNNSCTICGEVFLNTSGLEDHIHKEHAGETSYKCSVCDEEFPGSDALHTHQIIHQEKKTFECSLCLKVFGQKSHLNRHEKCHTMERPFKCLFCDKKFKLPQHLKNHETTHTGERPYKCTYCEKSFLCRVRLEIHQRIHTGERPFVCLYCGQAFRALHSLENHMRMHTREKPFKCSTCGRAFMTNQSLYRHKKKRNHA